MSNYNIHDLIEQVKYGDGAPAYAGDLQADLLAALDDVERLHDLIGLLFEAFPKRDDFEELAGFIMQDAKLLNAFQTRFKEYDATRLGLEVEAQDLGVDV